MTNTVNNNKGLDNIRVVLIETSHSGNIGSAARAMKTMGLSDLCLVNPKSFPDEQADALASNAKDVLESATVVDSLQDALADFHQVIGSSARFERSLSWDVCDSRRCGEIVAETVGSNSKARVALVFGRERTGLTNEELAFCQHLVHIPTNPDYSSLNLASAVQILAYECRIGMLSSVNTDHVEDEPIVTSKEMQGYYEQLEELMIQTGFLDPQQPRLLMPRLRRLYGRIRVNRSELNILRGILSSFKKHMSNDK